MWYATELKVALNMKYLGENYHISTCEERTATFHFFSFYFNPNLYFNFLSKIKALLRFKFETVLSLGLRSLGWNWHVCD